jgi:site-specific recombinase XerD
MKGASNQTIIRKLAAISSFWDFLLEKGYVSSNITFGVKRPSCIAKKPTRDFSDIEVLKIFDAICDYKDSSKLHKAILAVLLNTGMRKGELISLKRFSYQDYKGFKVLHFKVKGDRWSMIPLNSRTVSIIEDYLDWMSSIGRLIEQMFRAIPLL